MDGLSEDLYSLNPIPKQVDQRTRQQLVEKARDFHRESAKLKASEFFDHQSFYLISCKFLTRWNLYVGYDQQSGSKEALGKFFGSGQLPIVNEDIVESSTKFDIEFSGKLAMFNTVVKPGLQQGKDYIFATEQMWEAVTRGMNPSEYIQILRKVVQTDDNKKVQLYFQKVTVIPINNRILKDVEYETRSSLLTYTIQVSHYAQIQQFENAIKSEIVNTKLPYEYSCKVDKEIPVRTWLAPEKSQKQILFNTFLQGCKANSTFTYRLYLEGDRLNKEKRICDYDIFNDSLLILEIKEQNADWCFFNKKQTLVSGCSNCKKIEKLEYLCSCKYVAYCSKQCKLKDKTFHEGRCPNNGESDVEEKELTLNEDSRRGITGLRNLGNTCFMNSGLQCISHVTELTQYFLSNKYIQDINKDNPLGTKGQLCMAFANLLKHLWYGNQSSFSPTQLKRAIGKFQPMFSGYNQHDSGELITYLLDGLHEDLNRVKVKPYVQTKDGDDRPDNIVAIEQWENFLKRNQSQIVDLMYGQYRSVVDCPKCNKRSIQFDPFCMCSLPIINNSLKKLEVTYLENHLFMHKLQICFDKAWNWTMQEVANQIKKQIKKPNSSLVFYVGSYSSCQMIDPKRKASDVRSQYKYRVVYVRQIQDGQTPSDGVKVTLGNTVCHTYYKDESYRKSLTPYRMYYFREELTLKQLHHKLYSYYQSLCPIKNYEEQVINAEKSDQPLRLMAIATSRYNDCEFCKKKSCDGCEIPYSDAKLKDFVKEVDKDKIEFELYWRKNDKALEKKFDEFAEGHSKEEGETFKKGETTLQDCLRLFSEPETLAEDNAYYCPECKDFVLAKKQMQIYKAPKILALCLKRFKRKQYFQQKYSILVDYPLENLDLTEFVINKNLPTHELNLEEANYKDGPLLYDLFAISNHYGSTGGGHYTAFCKNPMTGQWYDFDDSSVQKVNRKSDLVSESAYILFYKRKQF